MRSFPLARYAAKRVRHLRETEAYSQTLSYTRAYESSTPEPAGAGEAKSPRLHRAETRTSLEGSAFDLFDWYWRLVIEPTKQEACCGRTANRTILASHSRPLPIIDVSDRLIQQIIDAFTREGLTSEQSRQVLTRLKHLIATSELAAQQTSHQSVSIRATRAIPSTSLRHIYRQGITQYLL